MPLDAKVLRVFIASPGDVNQFRDAVEQELHEWNGEHSRDRGIVLLPQRWETDSVPLLGDDGQFQVNAQILDDADILIAIFHSRLGHKTPRDVSGTVEEINRMHLQGKPVHLVFCSAPLPQSVDLQQWQNLQLLKVEFQGKGLVLDFPGEAELRRIIRRSISFDLRQVNATTPPTNHGHADHGTPTAPFILATQFRAWKDKLGEFLFYQAPESVRRDGLRLQNLGGKTASGIAVRAYMDNEGRTDSEPTFSGSVKSEIKPGQSNSYFMPTSVFQEGKRLTFLIHIEWTDKEGGTQGSSQQYLDLVP